MFAVQSGAKTVFACEESKEMVRLSHDVLAANQMQDKIRLLNKSSTDMSVPEDIPNRVSLVVTEIFDAGLFGEGVIATLQHAWKHLLLPPKTSEIQVLKMFCQNISILFLCPTAPVVFWPEAIQNSYSYSN